MFTAVFSDIEHAHSAHAQCTVGSAIEGRTTMIHVAATTLTGNSIILNSSSAQCDRWHGHGHDATQCTYIISGGIWMQWAGRDVGVPDYGGSGESCEKIHGPAVGGLGLRKTVLRRTNTTVSLFGVRIRCSMIQQSDLCEAARRSSSSSGGAAGRSGK